MSRIRHIAIRTVDPEREARFYSSAFQLKETRRGDGFISLSDGYIGVTLLKVEHDSPRKGLDHFGFQVESLEETRRRLLEVKPDIEIVRPDQEGTSSEYKVKDPDGNVFDISEKGWAV
jgi:catechol 2,3-dioxygenase-like lactoylglutathione lyase family enzyme